jgi:UPF0755 protein
MALSRGSKGFLVVLAVVVLGVAGALTFLRASPGTADSGPVTVTIDEGSSMSEIADRLEQAGVISNALAFTIGTRVDGRSGDIQAGTYELTPGMGTGEILDLLTQPRESRPTYTVTIPEGLTVQQTLQTIADAERSPHSFEALSAALPSIALPAWVPAAETVPEGEPYPGLTRYEGLLFPDTYEFFVDEDPAAVLTDLVTRTNDIIGTVPPHPRLDTYQVLVVASLIEREARLPEEQALISSVIHNRLEVEQGLQIDASVLYANARVGEDAITQSQLRLDSPWNTYVAAALPPTPIAGAGRGALNAAAQPAQTDYRYYVVSDPAIGAHAFAVTAEEHAANVARYRAQDG